jgi:hypothetical protein
MTAVASVSRLQQLHAKLAATPALTNAATYITNPSQGNYTPLLQSVMDFMRTTSADQPDLADNVLRVQMVLADGVTFIDTSKDDYQLVTSCVPSSSNKLKNQHVNVGASVTTSGALAWTLGENQNTRGYNMGATLSQSGVFVQQKRSNTTGTNQLYMAVRIGTLNEPQGNVIISIVTA